LILFSLPITLYLALSFVSLSGARICFIFPLHLYPLPSACGGQAKGKKTEMYLFQKQGADFLSIAWCDYWFYSGNGNKDNKRP